MRSHLLASFFGVSIAASLGLRLAGQTGPFNPESWVPTAQAGKTVHFVSVDDAFQPVSGTWQSNLQILSGADQATSSIKIGGHTGLKVTGNYLNIADPSFTDWDAEDTIDILMQVYGDAAILANDGTPRSFNFLTGTVPPSDLKEVPGGSLPVEAKNKQWNWVLFRIVNGTRADGSHYVGTIPADAQGAAQFGGVNGGTIRLQGVPNLIVRLVAFGQEGAFGEPDQVNLFASGESCDPEPPTNLVFTDFSLGTNFHLVLVTNASQTVLFQDNVGPSTDRRRAVQVGASSNLMNFGITDFYLGKPCNDPHAVKICLDYYDDPLLTGAVFGPEAYATDSGGGVAIYPSTLRQTLEGTGKWVRRSFTIPAVNLAGVNTAPLTGGPRLIFEGGNVFISRLALAVLRTGTNALAGQDPLEDCVEDPRICTDAYGNYAELDVGKDIQNGLAPGTSGGDQLMVQEEAGPPSDRRQAIRPDGIYLNFAITDMALGPSSQPNARLAICVTYFDDPALAGKTFRPEVYQSDRGGVTTIVGTPASIALSLEGTGQWKDAYFEIPDVKFYGVNQGPQAAARFVANGQVFFTRIRYAVIRPCGPKAGLNLLESCKPATLPALTIRAATNGNFRLAWPTNSAGFKLQFADNLTAAVWTDATEPSAVEGQENAVLITPAGRSQRFYRLAK